MKLPNDEIVHYKSYNGISFTVERTELVRCKDCKYKERERCGLTRYTVREYDFCSYGERSEDDAITK